MLTKRARRGHGRSNLLFCHNHTSKYTIRIATQPQVLTNFVLTLLSSSLVLRRSTFVVTIGVVSLPFVCPQHLRFIGCQIFSIFHNPATNASNRLATSVIQPDVHLYISTPSSAKISLVLRGSRNSEPSFS